MATHKHESQQNTTADLKITTEEETNGADEPDFSDNNFINFSTSVTFTKNFSNSSDLAFHRDASDQHTSSMLSKGNFSDFSWMDTDIEFQIQQDMQGTQPHELQCHSSLNTAVLETSTDSLQNSTFDNKQLITEGSLFTTSHQSVTGNNSSLITNEGAFCDGYKGPDQWTGHETSTTDQYGLHSQWGFIPSTFSQAIDKSHRKTIDCSNMAHWVTIAHQLANEYDVPNY